MLKYEDHCGVMGRLAIAPIEPYSVDDIISDGCVIERVKLKRTLERLRTKNNFILQGPVGTGRTWLARRLAFSLIGQKNDSKVRAVQVSSQSFTRRFCSGLASI